MGIIGPSGSGKTSLIRTLVGIWPPAQGAVRVDGAAPEQWPPDILGPEIGYVSQAVDLFDGTVAENIARMAVEPDGGAIVAAAQAAGAHEMILRLPEGTTPASDRPGLSFRPGSASGWRWPGRYTAIRF